YNVSSITATGAYTTYSSMTVAGNGGQYGFQVSSGVSLAGLLYTNNGNIGISTNAPEARLDVKAVSSAQTDMAQIWRNSAGTIISSMSATGVMMASRFVGAGDNLGNHIATMSVTANYGLTSSTAISAGYYLINGSTVLAILPGTGNLGVGTNAGKVNPKFSDYNTFVGISAGAANAGGYFNAFLGNSAGISNTVGGGNTFLGASAGALNTTGAGNSIVGTFAGNRNVIGSGNSILGSSAGGYMGSGGSFSSSTIVGADAGTKITTGSDNILLGFRAGYNITTGANNIVIGYNKDTSAPASNNELNIGDVLYGDLSAKTVGISTRIPQAALDVVSTGTAQTQFAQLWRRGDGVIVGSMSATGSLTASRFVGDGSGLTGVGGLSGGQTPQLAYWTGASALGNSNLSRDSATSLTAVASTFTVQGNAFSVGGSTFVVAAGKVGIGTTNPAYALEVINGQVKLSSGSVTNPGLIFSNGTGTGIYSDSTDRLDFVTAGVTRFSILSYGFVVMGDSDSSIVGTNFVDYVTNLNGFRMDSNGVYLKTNSINRLTVDNTGNVGIGTPVDATLNYTQIDTLNNDTAGPPPSGDCAAATIGRMIVSTRYTATAEYRLWICTKTGAAAYTWKYTVLN
ncbi:MAG: hypothetical protein Q7R35_19450, partial [Elusimicrobiota bacterium]|nr:hypothetical protein [Elusimicrobiota bacterium]